MGGGGWVAETVVSTACAAAAAAAVGVTVSVVPASVTEAALIGGPRMRVAGTMLTDRELVCFGFDFMLNAESMTAAVMDSFLSCLGFLPAPFIPTVVLLCVGEVGADWMNELGSSMGSNWELSSACIRAGMSDVDW